ncbi:sensor histidine kinase [Streptomyces sp. XD-27]|uniref:sensor histidine kinase n=1 Tax=Streptomyces sp. XD-27 TaxID=3062779 RepID=UPI0026F41BD7|nr:sensor histidine kinase [Streptomyces sp. XD-27]WKX71297.1 sensor domain-containing protein [Streptomyces sp. XD-27]
MAERDSTADRVGERGGLRRFAVRGGDLAFDIVGLPLTVLGGGYALAVLYAGGLLSLTVLGLPFVVAALRGARRLGDLHRWLVHRLLAEHITAPEPLPPVDGVIARGRAVLTDPVAWRTLLYLLLRLPLGVLGFATAVALPLACGWLIGYPLWARLLEPGEHPLGWPDPAAVLLGLALLATVPSAIRALSSLNRGLARLLLGPARTQRRLRQLESARSTLLAENTDHLRRLERDLHDGTQAQLVAIAITLSLADDALADDDRPDLARLRTLVGRARGQTDDTIAELRRLTQGIHPVALDSGLGEALPPLTAASPVPVAISLDLQERPEPAIERAVYFCVAELLTNIAKHSAASAAALEVTSAAGRVRLTVHDDGRGGAVLGAGSGLSGLSERLAAVDGTLRITSPTGGPTTITAELPTRL